MLTQVSMQLNCYKNIHYALITQMLLSCFSAFQWWRSVQDNVHYSCPKVGYLILLLVWNTENKQETHRFYIQIYISSQSKFKLQLLWKFVGTVIWMQARSFFISTYFLSFAIKRILLFVHVATRWDSFGENFMLNSHLFHSNNCQSENFKDLGITIIIKLAKKKLFQQFEMCTTRFHRFQYFNQTSICLKMIEFLLFEIQQLFFEILSHHVIHIGNEMLMKILWKKKRERRKKRVSILKVNRET